MNLENIKNFLKKYYGYILLCIILILIIIASFANGKYLLSNDNYSPELNPLLTIERSIVSPAWRSYRVLGFASESEQADIFRGVFFFVTDLVFNKNILAQLYSYVCLIVGVLSMATLSKKIAVKFFDIKDKQLVVLISGLIYLTTLWTAWTFNYNMMPYITQYGFFPLLLLSGYLSVQKPSVRNYIFLFLSGIFFVSTSVIATIGFIDIALFVVFIIWLSILEKRKIKEILIIIGVFLITQLFWIFPFVEYTLNSSGDVVNSFTNRSITSNTIDLEYDMMTLTNSGRFYTRLLGTTDDPVNSTFVFANAKDFLEYDYYKIIGLMPLFFAILGFFFAMVKKKYKALPFYIALFGLLFLIKNKNEPLGFVYVWLQDNIPLFKQVLRWTSSKLSEGYLIMLSITATVGLMYFINFVTSFFKKNLKVGLKILMFVIFISSTLFYAEYLFQGHLFTERALVDFPEQYFELNQELKDAPEERVLYLPPANNGYFREYEWGFVGSQFLGYVIENPILDMSLAIGSDVGEDAVTKITSDFDTNNYEAFKEDLQKYDIKYLLVDESLVKGRYGHEINWEFVENHKEDWNEVWKKDFLTLYEIEREDSRYSEIFSNYSFENIPYGSFVREVSTTPTLKPLSLELSDSTIDTVSIKKDFDYKGLDTVLYSNNDNYDNYPTRIVNGNDELAVSPSLPIVNEQDLGIERTYAKKNDYKGYLLEENFMDESIKDRSFYTKYESSKNIVGVLDDFTMYSLMDMYESSEPGDCSGGEYIEMPEMSLEENNLGFNLVGDTDLPCIYNNISNLILEDSIISLSFNWEADVNNWFGFCLYSEEKDGCINEETFFQTDEGFGNVEITIPQLISRDDNLTLTIYSFSPYSVEKQISLRNIELRIYSQFENLELENEEKEINNALLDIEKDSTLSLEIPLLYGNSSYVYSREYPHVWLSNSIEDEAKILWDLGQKQLVEDGYVNQYKTLFDTSEDEEYLWILEGQNSSNIPSSVCLTYQGDDKCISAEILYENKESILSKRFTANEGTLDISYNSTSFKEMTENVLNQFGIIQIPSEWLALEYVPSISNEYVEYEMFGSNTYYRISNEDISSNRSLVSIPQAKSDSWVAVSFGSSGVKVLNRDSVVALDGWKQGWDISNLDFNNIYVFYYPNLLAYLGYVLMVIVFVILIVKLVKEKRYGK